MTESKLKDAKRFYEIELDHARDQLDTLYRIKIYNRALDYYDEYVKLSEEFAMEIRECLTQDIPYRMRT